MDKRISIHALREESDKLYDFERTKFGAISIHALREESDRKAALAHVAFSISIHALREEGDAPRVLNYRPKANFNPRPPRGGRRLNGGYWDNEEVFQSTPSARRATMSTGEADTMEKISIHALREEGDSGKMLTPGLISISIHALREEGDHHGAGHLRQPENFNPRPPRGGRLPQFAHLGEQPVFQSTPSARRATTMERDIYASQKISIHALREEGDYFRYNQ